MANKVLPLPKKVGATTDLKINPENLKLIYLTNPELNIIKNDVNFPQ